MNYTDNLQSARLTTRFMTQDDLPALVEYFEDIKDIAYLANPGNLDPMSRGRDWIDFTITRYRENRLGLQLLHHKDTGELIGQCGLLVQEVNGQPEIEVGYHLLHRHWGKGYAAEAARMFRDYGFENNIAPSIVSIIHPDNELSKRVALANGMRLVDDRASFRGGEYNLFRITQQEWEALTK